MIRGALSGLLVGTMRRRGASFGPGSGVGGGLSAALDLLFTSGTLDSRVTYTGASLATLTDATGAIAYKPHNLLTYSGDFSNAAWSAILGSSSTAGTITIGTGASAEVRQIKSMSTAGQKVSASVTISVASGTAKFRIKNTHGGVLDNYSSDFTATTTPQTFSLTVQNAASVGDGTQILGVVNASDASSNGRTFIVSGAWLNIGNPQPYYPTTSAAYFGPRFTYDPVTHAALGLLIEEQRTNLLLWSSEFSNAVWSKGSAGTGTAPVVTGNYATAPDGTLTASRLVADKGAGTSDNDYSLIYQTVTVPAGAHSGSVYAKSNTGVPQDVLVYVAVGGQYAKVVVSVGNDWTRLTPASQTSAGGSGGVLLGCRGGSAAGYSGGQQSLDILIWHAQFEAGTSATTPIPTTSASVTRAADSAVMTGSNFSSWFNATQGTFVVEGTRPTGLTGVCIAYEALSAARGSGDIISADINDKWTYQSSGFATEAALSQAWTSGTLSKQAGSYSTNNFKACLNGGTVLTDSVGTVTAGINQLRIGDNGVGNHTLNAPIARLRYYPVALTNAQLQALTT